MSKLQLPAIGDRVLYVYAEHDLDANHKHLAGESRAAIVVRDFSSGHPSQIGPTVPCYNLQVFTDGVNDGLPDLFKVWSRQLSAAPTPGKFHWPSRDS